MGRAMGSKSPYCPSAGTARRSSGKGPTRRRLLRRIVCPSTQTDVRKACGRNCHRKAVGTFQLCWHTQKQGRKRTQKRQSMICCRSTSCQSPGSMIDVKLIPIPHLARRAHKVFVKSEPPFAHPYNDPGAMLKGCDGQE
jgi:hypothetical protein